MKKLMRSLALLLVLTLALGATALAYSSDLYDIAVPDTYTMPDEEAALWANADQTANVNILVEDNEDGLNPLDLKEADLRTLEKATEQSFSKELESYNMTGSVDSITAKTQKVGDYDAVCIDMNTTYSASGLEIHSHQLQYLFLTKNHIYYVTITIMGEYADEATELPLCTSMVESIVLKDDLFTEKTPEASPVKAILIVALLVAAAVAVIVVLVRDKRKKAASAETGFDGGNGFENGNNTGNDGGME